MSKHQRSLFKRFGYNAIRLFARLNGVLFFQVRCHGRENWPDDGGGLVCSNHQSHLDPILVGLASDRRMNFLARRTLFGFAPFRWLIMFLDSIPLEREGMGIGGLKETLRRVKRGELVLIFPEGTRTSDGKIADFKPGFCAIARRVDLKLIPVGIDGAYTSWPKTRRFPRRTVIQVCIGKPITSAEISEWDDQQLVAELQRRVTDCFETAKHKIAHVNFATGDGHRERAVASSD